MTVKGLVVDDDDDVRAMVVDVLHTDPEIRVIEDGLEATRHIKRAWPETKVVVVTGFTQDAYRAAASERGADAFVSKYDMPTKSPRQWEQPDRGFVSFVGYPLAFMIENSASGDWEADEVEAVQVRPPSSRRSRARAPCSRRSCRRHGGEQQVPSVLSGTPLPRMSGRDPLFSLHWCASPWIGG